METKDLIEMAVMSGEISDSLAADLIRALENDLESAEAETTSLIQATHELKAKTVSVDAALNEQHEQPPVVSREDLEAYGAIYRVIGKGRSRYEEFATIEVGELTEHGNVGSPVVYRFQGKTKDGDWCGYERADYFVLSGAGRPFAYGRRDLWDGHPDQPLWYGNDEAWETTRERIKDHPKFINPRPYREYCAM